MCLLSCSSEVNERSQESSGQGRSWFNLWWRRRLANVSPHPMHSSPLAIVSSSRTISGVSFFVELSLHAFFADRDIATVKLHQWSGYSRQLNPNFFDFQVWKILD